MRGFAREQFAQELEDFFARNATAADASAVRRAAETIRSNARQLARDGDDIARYLAYNT